jgi:hypothetical protein
MQGDIALAGFMMTAAEWKALDAPSRALLLAIATKPEDLAKLEVAELPVDAPILAIGTAPIANE